MLVLILVIMLIYGVAGAANAFVVQPAYRRRRQKNRLMSWSKYLGRDVGYHMLRWPWSLLASHKRGSR